MSPAGRVDTLYRRLLDPNILQHHVREQWDQRRVLLAQHPIDPGALEVSPVYLRDHLDHVERGIRVELAQATADLLVIAQEIRYYLTSTWNREELADPTVPVPGVRYTRAAIEDRAYRKSLQVEEEVWVFSDAGRGLLLVEGEALVIPGLEL